MKIQVYTYESHADQRCGAQVLVRLRAAQGAERDIANVTRLDEHTIRLRKEHQVTHVAASGTSHNMLVCFHAGL